jgi:DNA repair protein RadA/Sms
VAETRTRPPVRAAAQILELGDVQMAGVGRLTSDLHEWDRVLGGGIVPGSVLLLGGDPGVGKSTLALQLAGALAAGGHRVVYVAGEESPQQVALRAARLGLADAPIGVTAETDVDAVVAAATSADPHLLIVDSIQSVWDPELDAGAGSVVQLRESTLRFIQLSKRHRVAVLLIGHVTKEGAIAGPKVLEHMVDVVLYLEGERLQAYRLLRGVKNRFGATNEVGVFEMQAGGLAEVPEPSAAFLANRLGDGSGSAVVVTVEGTRPLLVEVQALATQSHLSVPRRVANGIDSSRLILLTAVLAKRAGLPLHDWDIHVNVAGGLTIDEPAADLGTALAILSSYLDLPLDAETVAIGEIGLAGELRSVGQLELRVREAAKLGFRRAIVPPGVGQIQTVPGIDALAAGSLGEAAALAGLHLPERTSFGRMRAP